MVHHPELIPCLRASCSPRLGTVLRRGAVLRLGAALRLGTTFVGLTVGLTVALGSGCAPAYRAADVGPSLAALPSGTPAAALPREGIDLLVWNVKKASRAAWPARFEALARDKDLVLLQEAYTDPRMTESLAEHTDLQWLMGGSFVYARRDGTPTTGVAIGSAARALHHRTFVTTDTEPLSSTPKASLMATYALEGTRARLLVVCVHAINFRPASALRAQLRALGPAIAAHEGPVLLGGDLNTHHRPRLEALEAFAAAHELRAVFENWQAEPRHDRPTEDARTHYRAWPLDHVYIRGLVVDDAWIIEGAGGSDHEPLLVRLSLPRPSLRPGRHQIAARDPGALPRAPIRGAAAD